MGGSLWVFSQEEAQIAARYCAFEQTAEKYDLEEHPFASDAFGEVWCKARDGTVWRVTTETFEASDQYQDLESWASKLLANPEDELGVDVLRHWESTNGTLPAGKRLTPSVPFILGGGATLWACPLNELLEFRRYLATQAEDMPDGSRIWLDTEDGGG
jgi:hypothetical protein